MVDEQIHGAIVQGIGAELFEECLCDDAGTAGRPAAVVNAINDALRPWNAQVRSQPVTPEKILRALGVIAQ